MTIHLTVKYSLTIRSPPLYSDRPQKQMEDPIERRKGKGKQKEIVKEKDDEDELEEVEIILNSITDKDERDGAGILNNATSLKVGGTSPSRSGVTKAFTKMSTERIPSPLDSNPVAQDPTSYRTRPINTITGRPDYFAWREKTKPKRVHYKSSRSLRGMSESHPTEQVDSGSMTTSEQKARRMAASAKVSLKQKKAGF